MKIALWIVQVLVGIAFIMAGGMKIATPYDALAAQMAWVSHVPAIGVKVIGALELLGGLGLILPSVSRIKPGLTPLAAAGLVLTMLGAAATHVMLGEFGQLGAPLVLGGLAAFVGWGRHSKFPIAAR